MEGSDYLLGLLVIITGLAISDIVVSLHGVLLHRRVVKWDCLALLPPAYVFVLIVVSWGVSYRSWHLPDVNRPCGPFLTP